MGSGSQQPVTQQTTQTRDPWSVAQPYLTNAMAAAQNNYNANVGYQPYTGQTTADINPLESQALSTGTGIASSQLGGSPGVTAGQSFLQGLVQNQGLNQGLQNAAGQYGTLYNEASTQQNPYLQAILETSNRRIGDRINASMSGAGRYGSGQHTDVMARALAESADPILAQDYQARQQQRMAATGAQADIYGQGLQRAGQATQLIPTLDQAQYAGADRLMAYGNFQRAQTQAQLDAALKTYNAQQAYPWEQLARFNAIAGQAGGLGGTTVTATPLQQPSTLQAMLGGGLAGAGLGSTFGPAGAGAGALGGGLLGLLGR